MELETMHANNATGGADKNIIASTSSTIGKTRSRYLSKEDILKKSTAKGESTDKNHFTTVSFHTGVELQVFKNFVKNYAVTRELRREDAIALDFVFGPTIQQVFEMVEEDQVTIRQSSVTRRVLVEVCGKSGDTYWIPPGHSVCQCMAFIHGKKGYCKHVLAAHFSLAITPKEHYKIIGDVELSKIYQEHFC